MPTHSHWDTTLIPPATQPQPKRVKREHNYQEDAQFLSNNDATWDEEQSLPAIQGRYNGICFNSNDPSLGQLNADNEAEGLGLPMLSTDDEAWFLPLDSFGVEDNFLWNQQPSSATADHVRTDGS